MGDAELVNRIEEQKRNQNIERALVDLMWPRVLSKTGMLPEIWGDRKSAITDALRQYFNPVLCKVLVDEDPRKFHRMRNDNDDGRSIVSVKGHDGIREEFKRLIRAVHPEIGSKKAMEFLKACEEALFYFVKDEFRFK